MPSVIDLGVDIAENGKIEEFPGTPMKWKRPNHLQYPSPIDLLNPSTGGWSIPALSDHNDHHAQELCSVIFPPVNHEGLFQVHHHPDVNCSHNQLPASPPPPPSPSTSPPPPSPSTSPPRSPSSCANHFNEVSLISPVQKPSGDVGPLARWLSLGIGLFHCKINAIATSLRNLVSLIGNPWPFKSPQFALAAAVLFVLSYMRFRRCHRRMPSRDGEPSIDLLLGLIRDKDKQINLLLNQITQLNEALLALHRVSTSSTSR